MGALKQHCHCERCGEMHWPEARCYQAASQCFMLSRERVRLLPETLDDLIARRRSEIVRTAPAWYKRD